MPPPSEPPHPAVPEQVVPADPVVPAVRGLVAPEPVVPAVREPVAPVVRVALVVREPAVLVAPAAPG